MDEAVVVVGHTKNGKVVLQNMGNDEVTASYIVWSSGQARGIATLLLAAADAAETMCPETENGG